MGGGNVPPDCNDELRNSELLPQKENVTVNGKTGNGLFRTVCARQPYDTNAITLPSGRAAGAFDVEAATPGKVAFGIRVEGGADVFHSSAGKTAFHSLLIEDTTPSANGKYTIYLDAANSDPGARVTIRFLDYAK